jgi:hypothetical protein
VKGGVRRAHIINGAKPGALLKEVFTNSGCGTMIAAHREDPSAVESPALNGKTMELPAESPA